MWMKTQNLAMAKMSPKVGAIRHILKFFDEGEKFILENTIVSNEENPFYSPSLVNYLHYPSLGYCEKPFHIVNAFFLQESKIIKIFPIYFVECLLHRLKGYTKGLGIEKNERKKNMI